MNTCNGCGSAWGGALTAHCSNCHKTFSGLTAFDKHRAGSHTKGRYCLDPETVTEGNPRSARFGEPILDLTDRKYPCWGTAGEKPEFWDDV